MEEPIFEHDLLLLHDIKFKTIIYSILHSYIHSLKYQFLIKLVICSNSEIQFHNFHNIVPIGVLKKHPLVTD